jgi:hypothetical protein
VIPNYTGGIINMIKRTLLAGILGILLTVSGCSAYPGSRAAQGAADVQQNDKADDMNTPITSNVRPGSLGGICLGDSPGDVIKILGQDYDESLETDESGYWGEDIVTWSFDKGIVVSIGKESSKVIRIVSQSPDFETGLGMKTGDEAQVVFEKYKPEYKEVISRHSGEAVPGWFHIDDERIIIFRFEENNTGEEIAPNSGVQEIVLAYWKHFD